MCCGASKQPEHAGDASSSVRIFHSFYSTGGPPRCANIALMMVCNEVSASCLPVGATGGRPGTGGPDTGSTLAPEGMETPEDLAMLTALEAACTQP